MKKENIHTLSIILEALLLIAGFIYHIYSVISNAEVYDANQSISNILIILVPVLVYLVVAFYSFKGYSVAHSNVLRNIMFFFGLSIAVLSCATNDATCNYILPVAAVIVTYISGRLGRLKKNVPLMLLVLFLLLGHLFTCKDFSSSLNLVIQWFVITNSYLSRYSDHKLAGSND